MKFKRILLSILTFAVITTVMAFTLPTKLKGEVLEAPKVANYNYSYYFVYTGPHSFLINDYLNPNNYVLLPDYQDPYEQCEYGNEAVCVVLTERFWNGYEWKPDFYYFQGWGSAYWGLNNFCSTGYTSTATVITKTL